MRSIRIILTLECGLDCDLCCNKFPSTREQWQPVSCLVDIPMDGVEAVVLTGGEPTKYKALREWCRQLKLWGKKVYLNTTSPTGWKHCADVLDGVTLSIHGEVPIAAAALMVVDFDDVPTKEGFSKRLWIESTAQVVDLSLGEQFFAVLQSVDVVEVGKMLPDGGCTFPEEALYILNSALGVK